MDAVNDRVVGYLNLLLGSSDEANQYWKEEFYDSVKMSFFARCTTSLDENQLLQDILSFRNYHRLEILESLQFSVGI
jgi:hypothetical protein